jgi:hypothetical protein
LNVDKTITEMKEINRIPVNDIIEIKPVEVKILEESKILFAKIKVSEII